MRRIASCTLVFTFLAGCASAEPEQPALETEEQKTLYAVGLAVARQMRGAQFEDSEIELIQLGLADGIRGVEPQVEMGVYGPRINALMNERIRAVAAEEKEASEAFCESMAAQEGARRLDSGAIYFEVAAGDGAQPGPGDQVKLHYHGTLRDGTVFDSSVDRGEPATFGVGGVIPCFSQGLQEMQVGGKAKLVCPPDTAYGDRGSPPAIKPGAALVFEVELLEILDSE